MPSVNYLAVALASAFTCCAAFGVERPGVEWDMRTLRLIERYGVYGRMTATAAGDFAFAGTKVLACEYVTFEVEGPGEIVSGPLAHANPARTEFGIATALLRAGSRPGLIRVRAILPGLAPGEVYIASAATALPLAWESAYAEVSRCGSGAGESAPRTDSSASAGDTDRLRDELRRLRAELTGKEQEIMEMRSTREKRRD